MAITAGSEEPDPPPEPMSEEVKYEDPRGWREGSRDVSWEEWLSELEAVASLGGAQESKCWHHGRLKVVVKCLITVLFWEAE